MFSHLDGLQFVFEVCDGVPLLGHRLLVQRHLLRQLYKPHTDTEERRKMSLILSHQREGERVAFPITCSYVSKALLVPDVYVCGGCVPSSSCVTAAEVSFSCLITSARRSWARRSSSTFIHTQTQGAEVRHRTMEGAGGQGRDSGGQGMSTE